MSDGSGVELDIGAASEFEEGLLKGTWSHGGPPFDPAAAALCRARSTTVKCARPEPLQTPPPGFSLPRTKSDLESVRPCSGRVGADLILGREMTKNSTLAEVWAGW